MLFVNFPPTHVLHTNSSAASLAGETAAELYMQT